MMKKYVRKVDLSLVNSVNEFAQITGDAPFDVALVRGVDTNQKVVTIEVECPDCRKEGAVICQHGCVIGSVAGFGRNHYRINAKSVMGIFSLNLSIPIDCVFETDNEEAAEEFLEAIDKFIVK